MRLSDSLNLTILERVADLYGPLQLENLIIKKKEHYEEASL